MVKAMIVRCGVRPCDNKAALLHRVLRRFCNCAITIQKFPLELYKN
jgi:hypothetical protein